MRGRRSPWRFALLMTEEKAGGLNRSSSLIFRKFGSRIHRLKWGQEDFMGRTVFRSASHRFEVGLVVPSHPRGGGLGRRSTGLPESVAAIYGALNLREISGRWAQAQGAGNGG